MKYLAGGRSTSYELALPHQIARPVPKIISGAWCLQGIESFDLSQPVVIIGGGDGTSAGTNTVSAQAMKAHSQTENRIFR